MENPEGVVYFLTATNEEAILRQLEYDKYLALAFRHNIINDDLLKRLKNKSWDTFFQARNELMAAYVVENLGHRISFHPHGKGNTIGEFSIHTEAYDIFTEVKSPIRKSASRVWVGNDSNSIRSVIKDAANKQFDKNNTNLLIFTGDMKVSITHEQASGVIEALYGTQKLSFDINEAGFAVEPEIKFEPNGLFQPRRNTRISAVATLEDRLTENGLFYSLKTFHNPYAVMPISKVIFKGNKQIMLDKNTGSIY